MKNNRGFNILSGIFLFLFFLMGIIIKFYPNFFIFFDQALTSYIRNFYPNWNIFFLFITKLGSTFPMILFIILSAILAHQKKYIEILWLSTGSIGVVGILNPLIKLLFHRERPAFGHLVLEKGFSFPSGHTTGSIIFYGTLLLFLPIFFSQKKIIWIQRFFLGILIFLVGISRIYLGVHFPSDVLGGYFLGLSWLFFTYPIYLKNKSI